MLKNISNLGSVLNKQQQKKVTGGCAFGRKCEPWDDTYYTTCTYGDYVVTHQGCGLNLCYGGELTSTNC
ncbi:hypothetical protein CSC81_00785 [Tenacibaculum discolor]|uniref:Uncharacterized protein n=1 Tax=Tenacibaculum discolor TaxID=361581 RepID=A0A2G1C005_9FLAO|nr:MULTISPECIES: hypothetical protein [Tenacibaculum]MDP2541357.1 hypothetical protein [Tenacibaculum discolor]NVK09868.1 hypothetical protein [Tenacibaculum sp.]PHN99185.1 hypothetical protein CSC81_00785 [Tenacibaculum discolor]